MRGRHIAHKETVYEKTNYLAVSINLSDIDCHEPLPDRIVSLSFPEFSIAIGRGSQSDGNIQPRPDNAWFNSRVMSRQHATIRADPDTRMITIQDDGSMHGTSLNGDKIKREPQELLPGDIVTFGAEVVRGEETYQPLKMSIYFEWEGENTGEKTSNRATSKEASFRNKFTVDFSEDSELEDDDDVQIISSSVREPSVEILYPATCQPPSSQHSPDNYSSTRIEPVTTTTHAPASSSSFGAEPSKTAFTEEDSEDDDDNESVENDPEWDDYGAHPYEDEDDDELNSDIPGSEDSFVHDAEPERSEIQAETAKDVSVAQPTSLDRSSVFSQDKTGREPSPSDAALARPRVTVTDLNIPTLAKAASATSIPPPPSMQTSPPDTYSHYIPLNKHFTPQVMSHSLHRPSHSFVDSYSYPYPTSAMYSTDRMNTQFSTTPKYPWDVWNSTPQTSAFQHQPHSASRPVNANALHYSALDDFSSPISVHAHLPECYTHLDPEVTRGQKRKADATFDYSDDDSIASLAPSKSLVANSLEGSSPAIISSSPATNVSTMSIDAVKLPTTEKESGKDDDLSPGNDQSSADELNQILDNLLEQQQAPTFDFQSMANESHRTEPVRQPPLKKVKRNYGNRSRASTAFKYTVTALAGVTIGALGTVVGLASLPVDYFA